MSVTITVRDIPEDLRDALTREARERGQSLQAFLLSVLKRQASFSRNRQLLAEIDEELATGGGAGADAPDAAEVLREAREERPHVERERASRRAKGRARGAT